MLKEDEKLQFGQKLYELRKTAGMTQDAAAAALDIDSRQLSRYECGSSTPNAILYERMLEVYKPNPLLQQINRLNKENQAMLVNLVEMMLKSQK